MADSLQINGTPSFVVGDEVVVGAVGYDQLKGKIDSVHKCGRTTAEATRIAVCARASPTDARPSLPPPRLRVPN